MSKYEVTSDRLAVGALGEVVDLDPAVVNVSALVEAGHVRPVAEPEQTPEPRPRRGVDRG